MKHQMKNLLTKFIYLLLSLIPETIRVTNVQIIKGGEFRLIQLGLGITILLLLSISYLTRFPILLVLFMILISIIPVLGSIPQSWSLSVYSKQLLNALINIIIVSKLYMLFSYWYFIVNCKLTLKGFKLLTIFVGLLFITYLVSARYLLYLKFESIPVPLWLYLIMFFSSFSIILRGMTSFVFFLVPYVMYVYPHREPLLQIGPEMPPEIPPSTPVLPPVIPAVEKRFGGFYNKHTHYHYYPNTPPEIPRSFFIRNFGYGIACAGLCLSAIACAQYYKSANAAVVAAYETRRAADIAARQAGLISEIDYYDRHPNDRPTKK